MYPAYDTPLTVQYKGELKYPATQITTQQYRQTHASVQMPHHLAQVESRVTPVRYLFYREGEASVRGTQTLTQGYRLVLTEWGNTPANHILYIYSCSFKMIQLSIEPFETICNEIVIKYNNFHSRKCVWKCRLHSFCHAVSSSMR